MSEPKIMPLECLRCRKYIPLTYPTFKEISYTHYPYCEDCLREGLKLLKAQDDKNGVIRIGDEVKLIDEWDDEDALTWVVTRITEDRIEGICPDGAAYDNLVKGELKATGRSFRTELSNLLGMMEDKA